MSEAALICVIDDSEAVRDSVSFLLHAEGWTSRVFGSAEAFLEDMPADCGCVVTDVRMPGMDGVALMRRLRETGCAAPVIVMTGHGDVPLAVSAMKDGAADFLQKPFEDEALLKAVRAALKATPGGLDAQASGARERIGQLSPREREVLQGLISGKANKVIAHDLGISARTVEIYRANVMTKMEAGSFAELVRLAIIAGLTPGLQD